jgi:signal transduction histidine kinase
MSSDTEAALRARVRELEACRASVVEAGIAERRRLERNLHDGAQQRLVALSLQLGIARARLPHDPDAGAEILDAARAELVLALGELREIARGIHPAVLTERGLGPALEALADRASIPVELDELPAERLPACVEATAYYVVSEALTNIARYADAQVAHVRVGRVNGHAYVEVRDDGIGGADVRAGTGLRGLADRLTGLDGSFEVISPPGEGTIVRAEVPCASS